MIVLATTVELHEIVGDEALKRPDIMETIPGARSKRATPTNVKKSAFFAPDAFAGSPPDIKNRNPTTSPINTATGGSTWFEIKLVVLHTKSEKFCVFVGEAKVMGGIAFGLGAIGWHIPATQFGLEGGHIFGLFSHDISIN